MIRRLLVIRFSSIGDIVLTSPVVRCLKQQLKAEIHFLTKEHFASLVAHNKNIDQTHCWPSDRRLVKPLIHQLKALNFDLIIDLHKNLRSASLANTLGCKRIAFDKLNVQKWLTVQTKKKNLLPNKHLVDRYFESLERLGVRNDAGGLEFFHPYEVANLAQWNLASKSYVCLAVGGSYNTKKLPNLGPPAQH